MMIIKSGKPFKVMLDILKMASTAKNINKLHNEINRIDFTAAPIIQRVINPKGNIMIVLKIFDKLSLVISSTKITTNTPKAQNNKWNDSLLIFHI